jgi:hypothetical protein
MLVEVVSNDFQKILTDPDVSHQEDFGVRNEVLSIQAFLGLGVIDTGASLFAGIVVSSRVVFQFVVRIEVQSASKIECCGRAPKIGRGMSYT